MEFAVVDLETTGLVPAQHDRVVEIAIERIDEQGNSAGVFETLVNPGRDVGPTNIHGIEAWEVLDAPPFSAIVGDVLEMLEGAVVVAHNARFDRMFLNHELARAGFPAVQIEPFCTMELLHAVAPAAPRRLMDCCSYFGLPTGNAHRALGDVQMTAHLLTHLLRLWRYPALPSPAHFADKPQRSATCCVRGSVRPPAKRQGDFLAGLVARLPGGAPTLRSSAAGAEYLNLIDRVVEDRRITDLEAELLVSLAGQYGLAEHEVIALHHEYVRELVAIALADGVITDAERRDLDAVGSLLGAPDWERFARPSPVAPKHRALPPPAGVAFGALPPPAIALSRSGLAGGLAAGMSVCFTGAMSLAREEIEARAAAAGLVVKSGVSGKLDLLVIADPDSQSGKARKARDLGTRLVAEAAFLQMIGGSTP